MNNMGNPLFDKFGNNTKPPFIQLINEAKRLKKTFQGDPKKEVERLLQTGQMSQEQFNHFSQIAQQVLQTMYED